MEIKYRPTSIRDLIVGYVDKGEEGVVAYNGKLDVRPPYQREFIYDDDKRDAVIDTVRKGFPLNSIYWVVHEDGKTFEVLDGQQRILSICQFCNTEFSIKPKNGNRYKFNNLTKAEQKQILDYKLTVYFCKGEDREKLNWFKIVNIAGEPLNEQEIRNAVYAGTWVTDAKKKFSKRNCAANTIGGKHVNGSSIRQDFLKTAIEWINKGDVESYMSNHQHEKHATPLWNHFESVINWAKNTFPKYRKEMKMVDWGPLYQKFKKKSLDPNELEERVKELMMDDDVTKKSGIYPYVLNGDEKHLNIRAFTESQKRSVYEQQSDMCVGRNCPRTGEVIPFEEMEGDHIIPWRDGGKTDVANLQMLCSDCNRAKGSR